MSASSGVPAALGRSSRVNLARVCESLDTPTGDGIRDAERAKKDVSGWEL
jgi:hypothetical protein